jgi:hypothetical protein
MTTMSTTPPSCIGEPVSWLRLEQFAMSRKDARVSEHVEACPACRACLDEISRDVVALAPLVVPADAKARRPWWHLAMPIGLAVAAAAVLLLVLRPRTQSPSATDITQVKGLGTVEIDVVRERGGVVRTDVRSYAAGDRWKVVVTCAADKAAWLDVFVVEAGATHPDYPLAPAQVACGNQIAVPGAFAITGDKDNVVCVRVSTDGEPARTDGTPGDPNVACVTLSPEH